MERFGGTKERRAGARRAGDERPFLLTLGAVLTVLRSVGILMLVVLFLLQRRGLTGLELLADGPDRLLPFISIRMDRVRVELLLVLGYYGTATLAAMLAWRRHRAGLVALLLISGVGLLHSGPLGLTIQAITLLGCGQALGADREAEGVPGL